MPSKYSVILKHQKDPRDWQFSTISKAVPALPKSVNHIPKCPPVVDQGPLGSCTGNAIAGAYEFDALKQGLPTVVPSRLFIYYNERVIEGTVSQDAGALISDGIKSVATNGVCDESLWAYDVNQFAIKPPAAVYSAALRHTALNYYAVPVDLTSIKQALAQGYVIVAGILVYASFESAQVAKNGIVPMPGPNEACLGGHCIVIVGYDDNTQHLICRNSWGRGWGDLGYFYLKYSYANPALMGDLFVISLVK